MKKDLDIVEKEPWLPKIRKIVTYVALWMGFPVLLFYLSPLIFKHFVTIHTDFDNDFYEEISLPELYSAFLSLLAFGGLIVTIWIQMKELREQRREMIRQADSLTTQSRVVHQTFEMTVMTERLNRIKSQIESYIRGNSMNLREEELSEKQLEKFQESVSNAAGLAEDEREEIGSYIASWSASQRMLQNLITLSVSKRKNGDVFIRRKGRLESDAQKNEREILFSHCGVYWKNSDGQEFIIEATPEIRATAFSEWIDSEGEKFISLRATSNPDGLKRSAQRKMAYWIRKKMGKVFEKCEGRAPRIAFEFVQAFYHQARTPLDCIFETAEHLEGKDTVCAITWNEGMMEITP